MADYYFDINGLSKHLNTPVEYNEKNPGLGITRETENNGIVNSQMIGGYKNSYNDQSYYAGAGLAKRFENKNGYYADVGGIVGGVTGYEYTVSPMAAAVITAGKKNLAKFRAMYLPKTEKGPATIMMNMGIPFK